jgi:hypothetical protein
MSNAEKIYELVKTMPEAQISEVLDFAEFLKQKASAKPEERNLAGDWSVSAPPKRSLALARDYSYGIESDLEQDEAPSHETAVGAKALEILQRNGFVGCLHEEDDLSVRYKEELDWNHKA